MSDLLAFDPADLWYIKMDGYGSKFPPDSWGGYNQSFVASDDVYQHNEVVASDHDFWGVCGCRDFDHGSLSLLVFDLDIHKAPEDFDADRVTVPEDTLLVRTQNGGFHVYYKVHAERGELQESDFQMTAQPGWDVDIRGSAVSMHVVAPGEIPGTDSPYEVVNNQDIKAVMDPSDAAERIQLDGEPLLEYSPGGRVGGGVDIDRDVDPPAEMPTCYHRGLQLRAAAPDDHPNTHKVNVLTALCGLAAGYDVETMVEHFVDEFAPGADADRERTRYQLRHLADHVDRGDYSPPAVSTLREFGILDQGEACDCDIQYHGTTGPDRTVSDNQGDSDTAEDWVYVRETYQHETNKAGRKAATNALEDVTDWMYVIDSETLWVYDDGKGYFSPWGEETAHRLLERELGTHYSQTEAKEIIGRLEARNQTRRKKLNARTRDSPLVCVGNGVVNLETGDLLDHNPKYKFTRGLKWDYDPARAGPEPVREFLDGVTRREADRDTILDHLAHGLMPGHPYRAFVIMYGPGSNGKTRLGKLLRGFVGEENAASVELQDLTGDDQFATGGLPGAFVNVGDDISVSEIRDTSILKSLTGDGTVRANEKYEKQYEFENEAAMFFSANEPPRIREQTAAISDRLYPVEMPYRFVDDPDPDDPFAKEKVPGIAEQLVNDDAAMRGLLLLAVKHAQDVIERNGQYSMPEGPAERREMYEAASDPIKRFALTHMEPGSGSDVVLKADAYTVYTEMCDQTGERPASADVFKQQMGQLASIDLESTRTRKLTPGEDRSRAWKYVRFADSAKEYMPDRLLDRYYADESAAEDRDTSEPPTADAVAYNATPITQAAQTLTGYVTVTAAVAKVESLPESTTKAILKDESGAVDLLTWDDSVAGRLEDLEGETVVVEDAEVGEHDGTRQLQVVDGLTEIRRIQPGVGHTEGPTPEADTQLTDAATDGGEEPDTGDGAAFAARKVVTLLSDRQKAMKKVEIVPAVAEQYDIRPDAVQRGVEKAKKRGDIQPAPDASEAYIAD